MSKQSFTIITLFLVSFLGCVQPGHTGKGAVDHSLFDELLGKYVKDGFVDYGGFKKEEKTLDRYLDLLDATDPDRLSRDEQYAFFINAYNAYTIKLILNHYPGIKSIKDAGSWLKSPWKIRFCEIGGKTLTLDEIEHEILRPRFKDSRVHAAVNCASKGCPPLLSESFQGARLDRQLETITRDFINNPEKNRLEGDTLHVSSIFKWFPGDFNGDVVRFFLKYADEDLRSRLIAKKASIEVDYLDWDWSLNGK
jgi:hypothetical protein